MTDISVIIPSNHGHHELLKIVQALCKQTLKPAEIAIIDSSIERGACPAEVTKSCSLSGIRVIYVHLAHALPGQARNTGIELTSSDFVAFIDVQTIPKPNWLEISHNMLINNRILGVWGATIFNAHSMFERLVRDGFFGAKLRITLPGSVFDRKVFAKVGQFIEWVRAGEDTDWMLRVELLNIPVLCPSSALIEYVGIIGLSFKTLLIKWKRNYTASSDLPHFFPHKLIIWLILYPLLILIAFNWNYLIADWQTESNLYLAHVTKIMAILPVSAYVVFRGILLPLKRGVGIQKILPIRFLAITFVCLMADTVKALTLSIPKRKNDSNALHFVR
jgi:glycosyltransferase involved in cell wall biosynthesis